jgi:excinuclease UvrABC ATPase subunit
MRRLVKCDRCEGEGVIPVSKFTLIGKDHFVECPKCLGDKVIRLPAEATPPAP